MGKGNPRIYKTTLAKRQSIQKYQRNNRIAVLARKHAYYVANKIRLNAAQRKWWHNNKHNKEFIKSRENKRKRSYPRRRESQNGIINGIYNTAKSHAKRRKVNFELTREQIKIRLDNINWTCELSGRPFRTYKKIEWKSRPFNASINRIDSTKGYTLNNIQIIMWCINAALNEFGIEVLSDWIQHIKLDNRE
jgi:hypothetical protein